MNIFEKYENLLPSLKTAEEEPNIVILRGSNILNPALMRTHVLEFFFNIGTLIDISMYLLPLQFDGLYGMLMKL